MIHQLFTTMNFIAARFLRPQKITVTIGAINRMVETQA